MKKYTVMLVDGSTHEFECESFVVLNNRLTLMGCKIYPIRSLMNIEVLSAIDIIEKK